MTKIQDLYRLAADRAFTRRRSGCCGKLEAGVFGCAEQANEHWAKDAGHCGGSELKGIVRRR